MIEAMSTLPARILGVDRGTLRPGAVADITVIDPAREWTVDVKSFRSKSVNSPFDGWSLRGRAVATIVAGRVKHRL
jgi:dihydroorotase